ncbi:MAG: uracil-DNA glycosylase [Candidatus Parvarchaeota archaeon]|nr:uracil-DNA glycosylase [Candidatus Parvarchaeum tengchongense]MCW1295768.1 uracil-DNA glycosylase [Candidatus Parvarchaeum tengchongense]MCW1298850.1 uracil-DNA glycosylase [Candidatus Parvarchaeum tengchongense]MCW1312396.1 uracil-DNA glycosylase [Candidatus Parvarchaeum tengchongense]
MESLTAVSKEIEKCTLCDLCLKRKNTVPGEGNEKASIVIIGEAPGKNEDLQGRPFIGMSGKFLSKSLESIGIDRSMVFITNAVKCRPPNNRKPTKEEIATCRPYLIRQLSVIQPKLILALGTSAASSLGIEFKHLNEIKSRFMDIALGNKRFKCLVTFHPSFPMRFPSARKSFLADLSMAFNSYKNLST